MRTQNTLFEQAADTLREAMESAAPGVERTRLIYEALELYHRSKLAADRERFEPAGARVSH